SVMRKMFGKGVIFEELNKIISENLNEYIASEGLVLAGDPLPTMQDMDLDPTEEKEYSFEYEIGLVPEFTIPTDLVGNTPFYKVAVDDEILNKEIADMQKRFGPMSNPEESQEGDILFGKLSELDADGNINEDGLNKMYAMNPDRVVSEDLKSKMGKGLKAEDTFEVTMAELFDNDNALRKFWETNVQGEDIREVNDALLEALREKTYRFEVRKINRMELMEVGQELFDKAFGEGTITEESAFRERLIGDMEGFFQNEAKKYYRSKTIKALIEGAEMPLPEAFLEKYLVRTREEITEANVGEVMEGYLRSLRWHHMVEKMQKESDLVKVEQEDIMDRAKDMVRQQFGAMVGEDEEKLNQFASYYLKDEKMVQQMFDELLEDGVFAYLAQENPVVEEELTATEFIARLKEEN
ncbi:MAG TPA: hypothetical protein ENJ82_02975, partial [Bacteroidetes bacterium]|nr:hypothetical protein [Bacteroidota bacterium]